MGKEFYQYEVKGYINEGAFGSVFQVRVKESSELRAMKKMKMDDISLNELAVLVRLDHTNVVKYYDHFQVLVVKQESGRTKILRADLCVITEYCQVIFVFKPQFFYFILFFFIN